MYTEVFGFSQISPALIQVFGEDASDQRADADHAKGETGDVTHIAFDRTLPRGYRRNEQRFAIGAPSEF